MFPLFSTEVAVFHVESHMVQERSLSLWNKKCIAHFGSDDCGKR
jgi:hypothetical protein